MDLNFEKLRTWIHTTAQRRGMPWIMAAVGFIDYLIMILPSDACLLAGIYGAKKRTKIFILSLILGRVAAAVLLIYLANSLSMEWFHLKAVHFGMEDAWLKSREFFEAWGPLSVGVVSLTPLPIQFVTIMSSLSKASSIEIVLYLILGSAIRYTILALGLAGGTKLWERLQKPD